MKRHRLWGSKTNIFLGTTLVLSIAIILFTSFFTKIFSDKVSLQFYVTNLESLKQVERNVTEMSSIAMSTAYQIYVDVAISKILFYGNRDAFSTANAIQQLENYRRAFPFISSIYIYNPDSEFLCVSNGNMLLNIAGSYEGELDIHNFNDKQAIDIMLNYRKYSQYTPIGREYTSGSVTLEFYTWVKYDLLLGSNSVILLNISRSWLDDIVQNEYLSQLKYYTIIVDETGGVIFANPPDNQKKDAIREALIAQVLKDKNEGYARFDLAGEKMLVVYTKPDQNEWRYIRVIPYKELTREITEVQRTVVITTVSLFLIGLLMSFMVSSRVSAPITKMEIRLEKLGYLWYQNISEARSNFLRDILLGSAPHEDSDYAESMRNLEIELPVQGPITIIMIKIDRYGEFLKKYNIKDQNINNYAIINVSTEVFSDGRSTVIEALRAGENEIAVLMGRACTEPPHSESLTRQIEEVRGFLLKNFGLSISFTVSRTAYSIQNVSERYASIRNLSLYGLFFGPGGVIREDGLDICDAGSLTFIEEETDKIVSCTMQGKMEHAKEIYLRFVNSLPLYPWNVYEMLFSQLVLKLNKAAGKIVTSKERRSDDVLLSPVDLKNAYGIDEINAPFITFFDRLRGIHQNKTSVKKEEFVQSVSAFIQKQYADPDLSVNLIADTFGMSVSYIGKAYKDITGHTILDQIAATRMDKAEELLTDTRMSVSEIAKRIGVQNTPYFYRVFKAAHGVTPAEYRSANKKHDQD
ncbi:MAG: AraC family transcriptional regulator [Clostridiales bacterium]|jgi:AraC-like DNA-binding protein|nr:AraC family transcriptional regulator [Clostridiales bacterium]